METKKEANHEQFVTQVDQLGTELLNENNGYLLLAYDDVGDNVQGNTFMIRGKFISIAECLYACMKNNPALAHLILSAGNAYAQSRQQEIMESMPSEETPKKKRNKKKLS